MTRTFLATALAVLCAVLTAAPAIAEVFSTGDGAVFVGCLAQAQDGFVLKAVSEAGGTRRSAGSNSAKASTPIGRGPQVVPAVRSDTTGSTTAKASTPIRGSNAPASGPRTGGMTTAKGSVAIPGRAEPETYTLDDGAIPLASYVDQWVEVTPAALSATSPATARRLKVERVRVLAAACPQ